MSYFLGVITKLASQYKLDRVQNVARKEMEISAILYDQSLTSLESHNNAHHELNDSLRNQMTESCSTFFIYIGDLGWYYCSLYAQFIVPVIL